MTKKFLKRTAILGGGALLILFAALVVLTTKRPTPPPVPTPNGYDDFVKAGAMVSGLSDNAATMGMESLRAALAANAEGLRQARQGFQHESRVPLQYTATDLESRMTNLAGVKRLAQSFFAEGKLAEREGRRADAARAYLDTIRLGREATRGGLIIDELVGVACEAIGLSGLQSVKASLNAAECREAIQQLEFVDAHDEPMVEVWKRDKAWSRHAYPLQGWFMGIVNFRQTRQTEQKISSRVAMCRNTRRYLMLELAARAFELEKGQPPKAVADLVPAYLKAVPKDATTNTALGLAPRIWNP